MYNRWWADRWSGETTESLSIIGLVNSGTIDCQLASLLWLLMEHRASILVAAGPSFAGKTTMLHALLDFLRPEVQQVSLRGYDEDFKFLECSQPANTYLVAEEFSAHGYEYLWGYQAFKAFSLLPRGYALGGTIHARNAREVVYVLHETLQLPLPLIAQIGAVITLRVRSGLTYADEPLRRVDSVSTIGLTKEGLAIQAIAARPSPDGNFVYAADETLQDVLINKFAIKYKSNEIAVRARFLRHLHKKEIFSRGEVRKAVLRYYQSQSP